MQFLITKSEEGWNLSPASGMYEGVIVARADGVTLRGVRFAGRSVLGRVKALWGTTILVDDVYHDRPTLRGLGLGGRFHCGGEPLHMDYDGFFDAANQMCRTAQGVTLIGDAIYARGAL